MADFIKKILPEAVLGRLKLWRSLYQLSEAKKATPACDYANGEPHKKTRVLFYHPNGLNFAGTEKSLQILAKHLDKSRFDVFFMYAPKKSTARRSYMENSGAQLIEFDYSAISTKPPFTVENMKPHIFGILKEKEIDVLVTAGAGFPEFPIANISKLPVVFINIFGSINPQPNIFTYLCISDYLTARVKAALPKRDVQTLYIQSEGPDSEAEGRGRTLRGALGFKNTDMVFGRIGRPDNNIFDPIGIRAFQKIIGKYPNARYLIMAPPPDLEKIVKEEKIPNVYFLPPSGEEKDVWAFHYAIDVLAHFRKDGETMGLNIAESMLCGRPVISHISDIWNAHLEFLEPGFSFVAKQHDVNSYAGFMEFFLQNPGQAKTMGELAGQKSEKLFLIKNNISKFESVLENRNLKEKNGI